MKQHNVPSDQVTFRALDWFLFDSFFFFQDHLYFEAYYYSFWFSLIQIPPNETNHSFSCFFIKIRIRKWWNCLPVKLDFKLFRQIKWFNFRFILFLLPREKKNNILICVSNLHERLFTHFSCHQTDSFLYVEKNQKCKNSV